ncbi:MAG: MmcQ/YjbR family DNA-binding protein [Oscillospiraceae bacterium]|nr:MmcQ/YjbR family DNA-binding protein [Oscillospiraceae bacterium]
MEGPNNGWEAFCGSLPGVYRDYPFGEEWLVFRHRETHKIFALFYQKDGVPCLNLKCEPLRADFLRRAFDWVTPGYHMNKSHWNTVRLNSADENEVRSMILHSYSLTGKKPSAAPNKEGNP